MELNKVLLSGNIADYLFIVVLITASVFISFFYYRRTIIKSEFKAVLVSIRIISLFLLLFLLLNPFYSYLFRTDKKPVNVFLVDKSLSLNTGGRINDMKNSIKSVLNNNKSSETENMFFLFGEDLDISADGQENLFSDSSLQKGGYTSNISRAINSLNKVLSGRTINSVLIFSDGIINDGGNGVKEALESKAPYYYIIPGDTARKRDVLVKTLFFNKTAVTGFKTTISAEINSYGFDKKILVNLYENASLILSKPLELTENINRYSVDFEIKSDEASIKKYKVEIASDKSFYSEELTGNNNSEECFIKFSSRELKTIVISGSPSPDFAFFSETLRKMQDYHAEFFTQKSGGEYYETGNPDFKNADFVVLFGYPTNISDNSYVKKLLGEVSGFDIPVIFIDAPGTDYENLKTFENVLPFTLNNLSVREAETSVKQIVPTEELFSETSSVLFPSEILSKSGYTVYKSLNNFSVKPGGKTLLFSVRDSEPLLIIKNTKQNKSAAFLGYGIFKWRLGKNQPEAEAFLSGIIYGMLSSLTDNYSDKKFTIESDKQKYNPGETFSLKAFIKNPDNSPDKVVARIKNGDYVKEIALIRTGPNIFQCSDVIEGNGDFQIVAEGINNGTVICTDSIKINSGSNYIEYKETKPTYEFLNRISSETGGTEIIAGINDSILNNSSGLISANKNLTSRNSLDLKSLYLRTNPVYLFILLCLLFIEWFLRKRLNL
jgi:hypothetical protein